MKVLVTGAGGQLATDVLVVGHRSGDDVVALSRADLDITDRPAVDRAVARARPDLVVNCAAWTAVDACESDPARAELVNGIAVGHLARAADAVGAHLVQLSTDYVFDGHKSAPYVEDDPTNPQSVYGRSKLIGEHEALAVTATVVRTSWVCSAHGANMVATVLRLAESHDRLRFVSDQRGHPTFTADLAPALLALGRDRVAGVVHVTNAGAVSWYEFAREVLAAAGLDPARVDPIATTDLEPPRPAARPANSVLANRRYAALGYEPLRDFRPALAEVIPAYR